MSSCICPRWRTSWCITSTLLSLFTSLEVLQLWWVFYVIWLDYQGLLMRFWTSELFLVQFPHSNWGISSAWIKPIGNQLLLWAVKNQTSKIYLGLKWLTSALLRAELANLECIFAVTPTISYFCSLRAGRFEWNQN